MTEEGVHQGVYVVVKPTQTASRGNQLKMPRLLLTLWLTMTPYLSSHTLKH
jgi:hypothetical protein